MYNTYADWQKQFPFWSVFTVKAIFRRLERLGFLESTQRFNTNPWNKTKWYSLNEERPAASIDEAEGLAIDGTTDAPSHAFVSPSKDQQSARACEPKQEASRRALGNGKREEVDWGDVDAAFELIPQQQQPSWLERAKQKLREQGMPWLVTCIPLVQSGPGHMEWALSHFW